jgi:hypothetical protein
MRYDAKGYILEEAARKRRNPVVVGLATVLPASHVTRQQRQPVPASQVYPRLGTTVTTQNNTNIINIFWRIFVQFLEKTTLTKKFFKFKKRYGGPSKKPALNVSSCRQLVEAQPPT